MQGNIPLPQWTVQLYTDTNSTAMYTRYIRLVVIAVDIINSLLHMYRGQSDRVVPVSKEKAIVIMETNANSTRLGQM